MQIAERRLWNAKRRRLSGIIVLQCCTLPETSLTQSDLAHPSCIHAADRQEGLSVSLQWSCRNEMPEELNLLTLPLKIHRNQMASKKRKLARKEEDLSHQAARQELTGQHGDRHIHPIGRW